MCCTRDEMGMTRSTMTYDSRLRLPPRSLLNTVSCNLSTADVFTAHHITCSSKIDRTEDYFDIFMLS